MAYILIVDDAADGREALCRFLQRSGHEVACVADGRAALGSILSRLPDLVLLDLVMPGMEGAGLLEVLRSYLRLQSLPVVVLTGFPESPQVARARHLKVSAVLIKGESTPEAILGAVNRALYRVPG